MKKTFYFLSILIFLFSCKKEPILVSVESPIHGVLTEKEQYQFKGENELVFELSTEDRSDALQLTSATFINEGFTAYLNGQKIPKEGVTIAPNQKLKLSFEVKKAPPFGYGTLDLMFQASDKKNKNTKQKLFFTQVVYEHVNKKNDDNTSVSKEAPQIIIEDLDSEGQALVGSIYRFEHPNENAQIYYTIDGSEPTSQSLLYDANNTYRFTTDDIGEKTIRAVAFTDGLASEEATTTVTIPPQSFRILIEKNDAGQTYIGSPWSVESLDKETQIYYTLDGSDPALKANPYPQGKTLTLDSFDITEIQVVALKNGIFSDVLIVNVSMTIQAPTISIENLNDEGRTSIGSHWSIEHPLPNAVIYYTTDGSDPSRDSTTFAPSTLFSFTHDDIGEKTIRAIAVSDNHISEIATVTVIIPPKAPQIILETLNNGQTSIGSSWIIEHPNQNAVIYYTTDNSDPNPSIHQSLPNDSEKKKTTLSSNNQPLLYDSEKTYSFTEDDMGTKTIRAIALIDDLVSEEAFVVVDVPPKAPRIIFEKTNNGRSPIGSPWRVDHANENIEIFYTMDGREPTRESLLYDKNVGCRFTDDDIGTRTICASAFYGDLSSEAATKKVTVPPRTPRIIVQTVNGKTPLDSPLRFESENEDVVFYYTTNNSEATQNSSLYDVNNPYKFAQADVGIKTIRAVAVAGDCVSDEATLTITVSPIDLPRFEFRSPAPNHKGYVPKGTNLTLANPKAGVTVYYTTNGTKATTSSSIWTSDIPIEQSCTIRAIAVDAGNNTSEEARQALKVKALPQAPAFNIIDKSLQQNPILRGKIQISTQQSGMTIQYKTELQTNWTNYSQPLNIKSSVFRQSENARNTIWARAVDNESGFSTEAQDSFSHSTGKPTNMSRWMDGLDDSLLLSQLSLPGSHESGATYDAPGSFGYAKCQDHDVRVQMDKGIRVLDIRIHEDMAIYHGAFYMNHSFSQVMAKVKEFLDANPSEFVIVSVKDENGAGDQGTWTNNVRREMVNTGKLYVPGSSRDYTVGELRGKFIIIRRFGYFSDCGINITNWPNDWYHNQAYGTPPVMVQDAYSYDASVGSKKDRKQQHVNYLLDWAVRNPDDGVIYINFLSATSIPYSNPGQWAWEMNRWAADELNKRRNATQRRIRFGIIMMDYATGDNYAPLRQAIVHTNDFGYIRQ